MFRKLFLVLEKTEEMKEDLDIFGVLISLSYLMEYHRLGALNNIHLLLTVLEAGQFKMKVPAD